MKVKIKSESSGKEYEVDTDAITCTCADFVYRREKRYGVSDEKRWCKHITSVFHDHPELIPVSLQKPEVDESTGIDPDGKKRYQRSIFDLYIETINGILKSFPNLIIKYQVCGSYRRLKDRVSDLDYLVILKDGETWDELLNYLESRPEFKLLDKQGLGKGNSKVAYMIDGFVHVDFKTVPKESWPFALLHFTGSKENNIKMRRRANSLGYKLNEYGLFLEGTDTRVEGLETEEDIYNKLNLKYQQPWDRNGLDSK